MEISSVHRSTNEQVSTICTMSSTMLMETNTNIKMSANKSEPVHLYAQLHKRHIDQSAARK